MSKYIQVYNTENDYQTAKTSGLIYPNVSHVLSPYAVHINAPYRDLEEAQPGDIIAYDENGERYFVLPDAWSSWGVRHNLSAEAVVVVPYSHISKYSQSQDDKNTPTVYGMALQRTACAWATKNGFDIPEIPTRYVQNFLDNTCEGSSTSTDWGRIPTDYLNATMVPGSEKYGYYGGSDMPGRYMKPIYLDNGEPNPEFYTNENGVSLDFGLGRSYTNIIKTHDGVDTVSETVVEYPAAKYCDDYSTAHIAKGQWFLPDIIQIAHTNTNKMAINKGLANVGSQLGTEWYWSSSEWYGTYARSSYLTSGGIGSYFGKEDTGGSVRPFAAFKL